MPTPVKKTPGAVPAAKPATTPQEYYHANSAQVEGIVVKVWKHDADVYARLAVYDAHAEALPPLAEAPAGALPRRQAHYVSLWFLAGCAGDGLPVSLQVKDHVMVTGYLRDRAYSESLDRLLKKTKNQVGRIQPGDEQVFVSRSTTYLVVETLIRFS